MIIYSGTRARHWRLSLFIFCSFTKLFVKLALGKQTGLDTHMESG
jgi:hypothetical protein